MDFPIADRMDEDACYVKLLKWLHTRGLACPRCGACDDLGVHRRHRSPILDFRCKACRRVFNAFTGTALHGTKRRPVELVLIVLGFSQGVPTAQLARELDCDRSELLGFRHHLQEAAWRGLDRTSLRDATTEADEAFQNAGEERGAARRYRRPAASTCPQGAGARHLGQ